MVKRIHSDTKYNTDKELISEFARMISVSPDKAKDYIEAFTECVKTVVIRNGAMYIRKLGMFHIKTRKKGKARNPRTGEEIIIPVTMRILFKPALSLKRAANERVRRVRKEKANLQ